jgi:hypothetical protein
MDRLAESHKAFAAQLLATVARVAPRGESGNTHGPLRVRCEIQNSHLVTDDYYDPVMQLDRHRRRLRRVAAIGALIFAPAMFCSLHLDNKYVRRPRMPRPDLGWTTPYGVKGITVFVTQREHTVAVWCFRLNVSLFALIIGCIILSGDRIAKRPPSSD